ncbi:hypothetical protein E2C01_039671 [Portunus trituberculatus]|uniref:Uncharacterized protein n=1 Tax=Portunus trituberculatus TaxID=210409 RepID=A0A5B7FKF3_PORTR|nr:hypothetical protein [Portunus trituberculatus]
MICKRKKVGKGKVRMKEAEGDVREGEYPPSPPLDPEMRYFVEQEWKVEYGRFGETLREKSAWVAWKN